MGLTLARALPAMTAVQAIVAMGAFSLSVVAPQLGISLQELGSIGSVMFGVGAVASLTSGWWIKAIGDLWLSCLCTLAVATAMLCLTVSAAFAGSGAGLQGVAMWLAAVLLGLAFGPETPASSSVLARVTPAAKRPFVFSVRQTGNQIGAIAGSLTLPALAAFHSTLAFGAVALLGCVVAIWCAVLARRGCADAKHTDVPSPVKSAFNQTTWSDLTAVLASAGLRKLALATFAFSATQVCLNLFLMSHAVNHWRLDTGYAVIVVSGLQAAGLAGRLLWGWVAQRRGASALSLLAALGALMGVAGIAMVAWPGTPTPVVMTFLVALVGLSASGWNGVMVAEITQRAPRNKAGAVTGIVLMFGYAGLAVAPVVFTAVASAYSSAFAFMLLFIASGTAGLILLPQRQHSAKSLGD